MIGKTIALNINEVFISNSFSQPGHFAVGVFRIPFQTHLDGFTNIGKGLEHSGQVKWLIFNFNISITLLFRRTVN